MIDHKNLEYFTITKVLSQRKAGAMVGSFSLIQLPDYLQA
jgi:hypothetical protein